MGQMMSTMVLNRKPSLFGGGGARGAGFGLEGQRGSKDSLEKMDLTVMDTKLKILEILQVRKFHIPTMKNTFRSSAASGSRFTENTSLKIEF